MISDFEQSKTLIAYVSVSNIPNEVIFKTDDLDIRFTHKELYESIVKSGKSGPLLTMDLCISQRRPNEKLSSENKYRLFFEDSFGYVDINGIIARPIIGDFNNSEDIMIFLNSSYYKSLYSSRVFVVLPNQCVFTCATEYTKSP